MSTKDRQQLLEQMFEFDSGSVCVHVIGHCGRVWGNQMYVNHFHVYQQSGTNPHGPNSNVVFPQLFSLRSCIECSAQMLFSSMWNGRVAEVLSSTVFVDSLRCFAAKRISAASVDHSGPFYRFGLILMTTRISAISWN